MKTTLSAVQIETLRRMRDANGSIYRMPGGFWVVLSRVVDERGVPDWWTTIATVRALEARGLVVRDDDDQREWCADRALTANGRAELARVLP